MRIMIEGTKEELKNLDEIYAGCDNPKVDFSFITKNMKCKQVQAGVARYSPHLKEQLNLKDDDAIFCVDFYTTDFNLNLQPNTKDISW